VVVHGPLYVLGGPQWTFAVPNGPCASSADFQEHRESALQAQERPLDQNNSYGRVKQPLRKCSSWDTGLHNLSNNDHTSQISSRILTGITRGLGYLRSKPKSGMEGEPKELRLNRGQNAEYASTAKKSSLRLVRATAN
jgi:hypothetical protein